MPDLAQAPSESAQKPADTVINVENVSKVFQTPTQENLGALLDIDLDIRYGEFVTVVGPSGCGKSTLLKLIAGLSPVSAGRILFQGDEVRGLNTRVGYVPQESKLFPWLTVEENVGFGLSPKRYSRADRERQVDYFIKLAGLAGFEKYYPAQLSGGMGKRASIIRALAYEPPVILMDEPFGPLDAQTRMVLQDELLKIWEAETPDHRLCHSRLGRSCRARRPRRRDDPSPGKNQRRYQNRYGQAAQYFRDSPPGRFRRRLWPLVEHLSS